MMEVVGQLFDASENTYAQGDRVGAGGQSNYWLIGFGIIIVISFAIEPNANAVQPRPG